MAFRGLPWHAGGAEAESRFVRAGSRLQRDARNRLHDHGQVARDANNVTGPGIGVSETRSLRIARADEYDSVAVEAATLSADRKSVFLRIKDVKPVMQMMIAYNLHTAAGARASGTVYNTIHKPGPAAGK